MWRGAAVAGPAFPVLCAAGDNLAVHRSLERCEPGDVLVITAEGENSGYLGEVLANAAHARGVAGVGVGGGGRALYRPVWVRVFVFVGNGTKCQRVSRQAGRTTPHVVAGGVPFAV